MITDRTKAGSVKPSGTSKVHSKPSSTPAAEPVTAISREYALRLNREEFVEALYPVSDPASLGVYKAPLVKWPRALLFPCSVAALAFMAAFIIRVDGHIATLIGFVAGCICTAHVRSRLEVALATALIARRFRQSSLGFGNRVEIDETGIRFLNSEHDRHVRTYEWDAIRSFAISQDAIVIRTSTAKQGPLVLPLRLFNEAEQLQIYRSLIALTR